MTIKINRLFHGYASVRDYQAKEAVDSGEDLTIICGDKSMTVPNKEIMSGALSQVKFTSIHNPSESYYLIDYPWRPSNVQEALL